MDATIGLIISFVINWLIFTLAVWAAGAIFQTERKRRARGFGTALVMALVVIVVIWLIWPLLPSEWALWVNLLIAFGILLLCFAIFWHIILARALGASVVCLLLLLVTLWLISRIMVYFGIPPFF